MPSLPPESPVLHQVLSAVGTPGLLALVGYASAGTAPTIFVPDRYRPDHPLAVLLGEDAFARLICAAGGETISLPQPDGHLARGRRLRLVCAGLLRGESVADIAHGAGLAQRRVQQLAAQLGIEHRR